MILLLQVALAAPPTGTQVAAMVDPLDARDRQAAFVEHLLDGDVPDYLEELAPVRYVERDTRGVRHTVEIAALRDYLAIGTDDDFLRAPLDLVSAITVARAWEMVLPTPKLVDKIYQSATERLAPRPMPPSEHMRSVEAYLEHRDRLSEQGADLPTAGLRAGHKKDLVLTQQLEARPDRVAIYGWHQAPTAPIQPLCLWHGIGYTDYSHGVRLLSPVVVVDGEPRLLFEVLADPVLWPLVSDEGPWDDAKRLIWPEDEPDYVEYVPDRKRR